MLQADASNAKGTMKTSGFRDGRSKFDDFVHERMPPPMQVWQSALQNVDRSNPPVSSDSEAWMYWLPDAAVVVGPTSDERITRHVRHWLQVRVPWLYLLRHRQLRRQLPVHVWRTFLNDGPGPNKPSTVAKKARAKARVIEILEEVFKAENVQPEVHGIPAWFDEVVSSPPPTRICQEIAWELCELGFRVELDELDHALIPRTDDRGLERAELIDQVSPGCRHWYFRAFPQNSTGLTSYELHDRIPCLEALRRLMLDWPNVPHDLKESPSLDLTTSPDTVTTVERAIASFYVQSFFDVSGRAAVIPRRLPVQT